MSVWFPLHQHTHFSLLDGLSKPEQVAARLAECGYAGGAVTDHGTISGVPGFIKALEKKKLKPVAGSEFYVCDQHAAVKPQGKGDLTNARYAHLCVLAKNARGWKNLMRASSASYRPEHFYKKPRLSVEQIGEFARGEFIAFSGHLGSDLADACFEEPKFAYNARSYDDAKALVAKDWEDRVARCVRRYQAAFGKENFYGEVQLVDHKALPAALVVARIVRHVCRRLGVPCLATADSHYCRQEDAVDQRLLLCTALDTTFAEVRRRLDADEDVQLGGFFRSNNYHIPDAGEVRELHSDHPEELANTLEVAGRCEAFSVGGRPLLPKYPCPDGLTSDQYLARLAREGWDRLVAGRVPAERLPEYERRLWQVEMPVVESTGGFLADYFLIKADIIRHARETLRVKTGLGRGSAAGCLVSYLTGITRLDPIPFGLSFARFYNAGRNSPGRVALPDIDSDFPQKSRPDVIAYVRDKWGHDKVSQMVTFSRMQGRGALKDVFRAHNRLPYEEMNRVTEHIPDEAEISDQLQLMMEETGEASIIRWALENNADALKEWAFLRDDGEVDGPLGTDFAQAIRLEGTKRNMGKHASGVVICSEPLADICPLVWDRAAGEMIVGVDMRDAELMGLPKVDILGLRTLDCLQDAESVIRTGRIAA